MFLRKFYQRKNVAEFSDKFFQFQYATLEIFKGALNNYTMLKLLFNQHPPFCNVLKNVSHQYYATNQDTKPHILLQNCPKIGVEQCLAFFICHSFYYAAFFISEGKLKYIIHFLYEISNDIIQCYQFIRRILPLLPLITPNVD